MSNPAHESAAPGDDLSGFLEQLFLRTAAGIQPGLETTRALLAELGNPHQGSYLVVHVSGTNGKGSVCATLAAILEAAGLRCGLYTSPHLHRFNERIRLNGSDIDDTTLAPLVAEVDAADRRMRAAGRAQRPATFFEFTTALAFLAFARAGMQVAVIETGLGGTWDSTNLVDPLVSVITPISLDHAEYLGNDLICIAGEKAGIIKPGRPVISATQEAPVAEVIRTRAREVEARCIQAEDQIHLQRIRQDLEGQQLQVSSSSQDYGRVRLPLLGRHQLENLALALAAAEWLFDTLGVPLPAEALREGLTRIRWPGRMTRLSSDPPVLLDGAHNPAGARVLKDALRELFGRQSGAFVLGAFADKDVLSGLRILAPSIATCFVCPLQHPRALPPEQLADIARGLGLSVEICTDPASALKRARGWAKEHNTYACATGSLMLIGELLGG